MTEFLVIGLAIAILLVLWKARMSYRAQSQNIEVVQTLLEQRYKSVLKKALLPYAFALYFCGFSAKNGPDERLRKNLARLCENHFRVLLATPGSGICVVIASVLLTAWLPVLAIGARDLPVLSFSAIVVSPLLALFVAPLVGLLPWYGRWILLAPVGIYVFPAIAVNGMLRTVLRRQTK